MVSQVQSLGVMSPRSSRTSRSQTMTERRRRSSAPGTTAVVEGAELVEQLLVLPEEAGGAAMLDDELEDADGEVGLSETARAGEEDAVAAGLGGVAVGEAVCDEKGGGEAFVGGLVVEVAERAGGVAGRDPGLVEDAIGAELDAAGAGFGEAGAGPIDELEAGALADGAEIGHEVKLQYGRVRRMRAGDESGCPVWESNLD